MAGNLERVAAGGRLRPARRRTLLAVAASLWIVATAGGLARLYAYGSEPGPPSEPPRTWPRDARFQPDPERPTLLVFAHPQCPCTGSVFAELERLVASTSERLAVTVWFYHDPELGTDWLRSATWQRAQQIPGVRVAADPGGEVAGRFGARTSGDVLLYSSDGHLRLAGGVTPGRGHEGGSAGFDAILAILDGGAADEVVRTPVYGCPLADAPCEACER